MTRSSAAKPRRRTIPDFWYEVRHKAVIRGFTIAPSEITRRLGIRPTSVMIAGEPIRRGLKRVARCNVWVLETPYRRFDTPKMNTHGLRSMDALVSRLYRRRAVLRKLLPPGELYFETYLATDQIFPCLALSLPTLRRIVDLRATWVANFYPS